MKAPSEPPGDPEFFVRLRTTLDQLIVDGRVGDVSTDPVTGPGAAPLRPLTREDLPLARAPQPVFELPRVVLIVIVSLLVGLGATAAAFVFQDRFAQLIVLWQHGR